MPTIADFWNQPDDEEEMSASDLRHSMMRKVRVAYLMDPE